jgi:hypothetical protein
MPGQVAKLVKKIIQRIYGAGTSWRRWLFPVIVSATAVSFVLLLSANADFMPHEPVPFGPPVVFQQAFEHEQGWWFWSGRMGGPFWWPRTDREVIWSPAAAEEEFFFIPDIPRGTSFDRIARKFVGYTVSTSYGHDPWRNLRRRLGWDHPPSAYGPLGGFRFDKEIRITITAGLRWLHFHQDEDGRWDQDGFHKNCERKEEEKRCDGRGTSQYDVGGTSLALLAFLGDGHTHRVGPFRKTVKKGLKWLRSQQQENGSFGPRLAESWIYNSAMATMALSEACAMTGDHRLKTTCRKGVDFLLNAQNPGLAWKYEPRSKRNDTSVTGWMVLALKAAEAAGIQVEKSVFEGALNWFDRMTDKNGKVGYMRPGDDGSVIRNISEHYEKLPVMTALATICRLLCGVTRRDKRTLKAVDLLMQNLPDWNKPRGDKVNMYYWFWGTHAMRQYGGQKWHKWNTAMKKALLDTQRVGGCADGSWDPVGQWGMVGGRVYSTAINCMTLETFYLEPGSPLRNTLRWRRPVWKPPESRK